MNCYGKVYDRYDYFLPHSNRITAVKIYYKDYIHCFSFHLSDGSEWDIGCAGNLGISRNMQTVDLADNEVIIGFKAKSDPEYPAVYVELQFITAR